MTTIAKVDIKIGALAFAGEGDKEWLAKQLDKLIQHAPSLLSIAPGPESHGDGTEHHHKAVSGGKAAPLASFLKSKNVTGDQDKFLATAAWLHLKGTSRLTPAVVIKAMDENDQGKVTNPSLVLKRLVKKGYCERSGAQFYVTDDGKKSLG